MTYHIKTSKEAVREYFDSLMVEMRLIDSAIPSTEFELYGKKFQTPIMTAALSHLGTFNPGIPNGMVQCAKGAQICRIYETSICDQRYLECSGIDAYKALALGATAVSGGGLS